MVHLSQEGDGISDPNMGSSAWELRDHESDKWNQRYTSSRSVPKLVFYCRDDNHQSFFSWLIAVEPLGRNGHLGDRSKVATVCREVQTKVDVWTVHQMKVAVGSSREVVIVGRCWPRLVEVRLYTLSNVRCTRCIIMLQSNKQSLQRRFPFLSRQACIFYYMFTDVPRGLVNRKS